MAFGLYAAPRVSDVIRNRPAVQKAAEGVCHTANIASRMSSNGNDLTDATLRLTLSGQRVLSYDERLTVACFDHGIHLAQTGANLPDWLATAPRWARVAVAIVRSSALRVIQEDRMLSTRGAVEDTWASACVRGRLNRAQQGRLAPDRPGMRTPVG